MQFRNERPPLDPFRVWSQGIPKLLAIEVDRFPPFFLYSATTVLHNDKPPVPYLRLTILSVKTFSTIW